MLKDFLVGTFAKILEIVLIIVGAFLLIDGLIFAVLAKTIGGILCLGASFGVMYALRQRTRSRR